MSEFFDAHIMKCPHCGAKFASCEGPDCDCEEEMEREPEETDPLMKTLLSIGSVWNEWEKIPIERREI